MAHELNVTKYWINKKGEKVWYNEPSVKSSKHPKWFRTLINDRKVSQWRLDLS